MSQTIKAVIIEPNRIPRPIMIEDDLLALNRAVNIDRNGRPLVDRAPFAIAEIKDDINIISSPRGEELHLPIVRTVGRFSKFYGIIYIVKMRGFNLVSMDNDEAIDYCIKFMDETVSLESLGLPPIDYGDSEDDNISYTGRVSITFND